MLILKDEEFDYIEAFEEGRLFSEDFNIKTGKEFINYVNSESSELPLEFLKFYISDVYQEIMMVDDFLYYANSLKEVFYTLEYFLKEGTSEFLEDVLFYQENGFRQALLSWSLNFEISPYLIVQILEEIHFKQDETLILKFIHNIKNNIGSLKENLNILYPYF